METHTHTQLANQRTQCQKTNKCVFIEKKLNYI